ncbi:MAG: hypothetical protein GY748_21050 [Planctomycetaceae bacterium]|nr:hypothetical protein [Planctomycetaceae bacterium]
MHHAREAVVQFFGLKVESQAVCARHLSAIDNVIVHMVELFEFEVVMETNDSKAGVSTKLMDGNLSVCVSGSRDGWGT